MTVSMSMNLPPVLHDSGVWRDYADRMREWARNLADRARAWGHLEPAGHATGARHPGRGGNRAGLRPRLPPRRCLRPRPSPVVIAPTPGAGENHEIKLRILRADADVVVPVAAIASRYVVAQATCTARPRRDHRAARQEIDGVRVNGERTTWTIEAGKLGNEKLIVITVKCGARPTCC